MAEARPVPCAVASRRRLEPLHATASRVGRWLLLEQPGPWGREALAESRLETTVARTLASQARRHGVRVVLVRRPGWVEGGPRRVVLARTEGATGWAEQLDVDGAEALTRLDLGAMASETAPGVGAPAPAATHLVCTNGRHDRCCADFGRPVIRALHGAGVPEVWESSHVGGDRFAANVVTLPVGVYYGRVPPEGAADLLARLGAGELDLAHYRGRCGFPPLVQAAEIAVRQATGERSLDGLALLEARIDGDEVRARWDHAGRHVHVVIRRTPGPAERLTCSGGASRPWRYEVLDLG